MEKAMGRERLMLLFCLISVWAGLTMAQEACYAGKFDISTSLAACAGNERGYTLRNASFYCSGNPVHCEMDPDLVCQYVYKTVAAAVSPAPQAPSASTTARPRPTASASPSCTAVPRPPSNNYCRSQCCSDAFCPTLLTDSSGLVVNLSDEQIVRHGLMNDKFSTYNVTLDGSSSEVYRPRCQCEVRGNFLNKRLSCISSIGSFPQNRPFLECTLCYPCYKTSFEAHLAANSSSAIVIQNPTGTVFCPQRDGTDPVGCFAGEELDRVCLDNYNAGMDVNGDALFCSQNRCNPRSLCNCSYVDFHEECRSPDGLKYFRTTLPILQKDRVFPKSEASSTGLSLPRISFDGDYLLVDAAEPYNLRLSYNGRHFSLKSQMTANYNIRRMIPPGPFSVSHAGSGNTFNFYLQPVERENHRTLGIVMFSLSLIFPAILLCYCLYLCLPKTASCIGRIPVYQKIRSGGSQILDQFLPAKISFAQARTACIFLGVGLAACSIQLTEDKMILGSNFNTVILDDCLSVRQYNIENYLVLNRPNVDCALSVSHYNGSEVVFEETAILESWTDCRLRDTFVSNFVDAMSCSSSLTETLLVLVIISLLLLICVLAPTFMKICFLVMALAIPTSACDFSQSITSSSLNCVNTPSGQNCSITGTFSSYLTLGQTFCVGTKNSFGVPGKTLSLQYLNSTESLQTKIVGYTQSFDQSYFSKNRCNDCLGSCNGDCSASQCQLIGGFGVNPNGQNTDNSVLYCPSYAGCDLIEDSVSESWTSGCLLKPNCHWWQYISCGSGEVSALSSIFSSRVSSGILLSAGNQTRFMRTTDKQPVQFEGFLISTSTQVNPVDFNSLGYDTLVKKSGYAYLCRTDGFDESKRETLGDYFCVESTCTYVGPDSIRIPADICEHDTLGSDSVFSCYKSFYSELETQSTCRRLPFTTEAGLLFYQDNQLLMDLSISTQIEVRVSAINSTFEFTSDIIKPDLSVGNCSGYANYSGSSSCHLKGSCRPSGLVSLSTESSSVILVQDSALCNDGLDFRFSVFEEDVDFDLLVGNSIFNQTLRIHFTALNYTAQIQEHEPEKGLDDEGWEPFASWDKILNGLGTVWDWLIITVECALILLVVALLLYISFKIFMCLLPTCSSCLRKARLRRAKDRKEPERRRTLPSDAREIYSEGRIEYI